MEHKLANGIDVLMCGYIHEIEKQLKSSDIIPKSIIDLCVIFYYKNNNKYMVIWFGSDSQNHNKDDNKVLLYKWQKNESIQDKKHWFLKIHNLDNMDQDITKKSDFDVYTGHGANTICMVKNPLVAPKLVTQTYPNNNYIFDDLKMIFRCGGHIANVDVGGYRDIVDMIFFKTNELNNNIDHLDAYYTANIQKLNEKTNDSSMIHDYMNNKLIMVGGMNEDDELKDIGYLDIQHLQWKWFKNVMNYKRRGTSLCFIDDSSVMIMGGYANNEPIKTVELHSTNNAHSKCKTLKSLCSDKGYGRSIYVEGHNKVVICGGYCGDDMEIYDIQKDIWQSYRNMFLTPKPYECIVWNNPNNPNIIYVGCEADMRSFGIQYFDLRTIKNDTKSATCYDHDVSGWIMDQCKIVVSETTEGRSLLI